MNHQFPFGGKHYNPNGARILITSCVTDAEVHRAIYLSIYRSFYLHIIYIYIHTFISIYIYFYLYLSISIYIYLYLSMSIYIYLYLSISIYIYLYLSISIYIYLYLSIYVYIYLYLSTSIYIYLYLSVSNYIYLYDGPGKIAGVYRKWSLQKRWLDRKKPHPTQLHPQLCTISIYTSNCNCEKIGASLL